MFTEGKFTHEDQVVRDCTLFIKHFLILHLPVYVQKNVVIIFSKKFFFFVSFRFLFYQFTFSLSLFFFPVILSSLFFCEFIFFLSLFFSRFVSFFINLHFRFFFCGILFLHLVRIPFHSPFSFLHKIVFHKGDEVPEFEIIINHIPVDLKPYYLLLLQKVNLYRYL